jgi:hypothetical protein
MRNPERKNPDIENIRLRYCPKSLNGNINAG